MIRDSGRRRFPPRLEWQPIFYPVLSEDYAIRIARDWNTKDDQSGFVGYVLRFSIRSEYINRFQPQKAGGNELLEFWIPAEELETFNDNLVGEIELITNSDHELKNRGIRYQPNESNHEIRESHETDGRNERQKN